jgi:hypothetical protein
VARLTRAGVLAFSSSGGIVGRGVLLDWASWAARNGIHRSPFETGAIELTELRAVAAETGVAFRRGDVLFIRSGFTAAYDALSVAEREGLPHRSPGGLLGLEATRDSLRWLWEAGFAAVAGDAMGFERGPATGPWNEPGVSIHQWALAGWGMPIGEMFDLEALAEACRARNRWTFFLCSVPLKVSFALTQHGMARGGRRLTVHVVDTGGCGQSRQCHSYPLIKDNRAQALKNMSSYAHLPKLH